jgi:hypothetical protein
MFDAGTIGIIDLNKNNFYEILAIGVKSGGKQNFTILEKNNTN